MVVAKTKECKRRDHKIKLYEKIKKNIQPDFKTLVLALCYYCGDKVKYEFTQKTCSKESRNMAVDRISGLQ